MDEVKLYLDVRDLTYDSNVEQLEPENDDFTVITDIETPSWEPVSPDPLCVPRSLSFVDGVQRVESRVLGEINGHPFCGMLASVAAGAVCVDEDDAYRHFALKRSFIVSGSASPKPLTMVSDTGSFTYEPVMVAGTNFDCLSQRLNDLRADLERTAIVDLVADGADMVMADGRLPRLTPGPVLGLIKTLSRLYVSDPEQIACVRSLKVGQRTPVFCIERGEASVYSWFISLAERRPSEPPFSNIARIETAATVGLDRAVWFADATANELYEYASTPDEDPRAPQNLLPVGQLERELRNIQGDLRLIRDLIQTEFWKEGGAWTAAMKLAT